MKIFSDWFSVSEGNIRLFLEEIKHNMRICKLAIEDKVSLEKIVKDLDTTVYDKLISNNFDFNKLQKNKIKISSSFIGKIDESWNEKSTKELITNIYDKIKDIKTMYPHSTETIRRRWNFRIININNKLNLLVKHTLNN